MMYNKNNINDNFMWKRYCTDHNLSPEIVKIIIKYIVFIKKTTIFYLNIFYPLISHFSHLQIRRAHHMKELVCCLACPFQSQPCIRLGV